MRAHPGPLAQLKVLEFAAIGPAPFCGMLLSDMGADVVRIDRKDAPPGDKCRLTFRGRRSVALDLKNPAATEACLKLAEAADVLIEGFRPGVMERLGLGPEAVQARNPRLVYGRMTGWGQTGPYAQLAGHDITYLAVSGALHAIGARDRPAIPLNLIADYGGGALYLAFGIVSAVLHARATGEGQVIDCAMTDGVASLLSQAYGNLQAGIWRDEREANYLDGGAHFYNVYQCADDRWIAVGAIEPKFYAALLSVLGVEPSSMPQGDRARWPLFRDRVAEVVRTRSRDQWIAAFDGIDACIAPVLSLEETYSDLYHVERGGFAELGGIKHPAPAPRLSRTPGAIQGPPPEIGAHTETALADWGFSPAEIAEITSAGAI